MANYIDHSDIEKGRYGTVAAAKQFSTDQATAIDANITKVHGLIIEIAGSELTSTEGLKFIEAEAYSRWHWNIENSKERPVEIITPNMKESILAAKKRAETTVDAEIYCMETW